MCPIVPTFTCGFVRSNFSFAIFLVLSLPKLELNLRRLRTRPRSTNPAALHSRSTSAPLSLLRTASHPPETIRGTFQNLCAIPSGRNSNTLLPPLTRTATLFAGSLLPSPAIPDTHHPSRITSQTPLHDPLQP